MLSFDKLRINWLSTSGFGSLNVFSEQKLFISSDASNILSSLLALLKNSVRPIENITVTTVVSTGLVSAIYLIIVFLPYSLAANTDNLPEFEAIG